MPAKTEIILFAIRTAIRLGGQAREAYIDSTRGWRLWQYAQAQR